MARIALKPPPASATHKVAKDLIARTAPLKSLSTHARNPRRGDVEAIAASLTRFGQVRPILVNTEGVIIAGNHTYLAASSLGWTHIAAVLFTGSKDDAEAYLAADNRISDLGGYDDAILADLLRDIDARDDLESTGYDNDALDRIIASMQSAAALGAGDVDLDDNVPATPDNPVTKVGDVITLGHHILVCGDSSDPDVIAAAFKDRTIDTIVTDPPYGVAYTRHDGGRKEIANDTIDGAITLFSKVAVNLEPVMRPGCPVLVFCPPGPGYGDWIAAVNSAWPVSQNLVWHKGRIVLGRSDYHYSHEPIIYAKKPGGKNERRFGGRGWFGPNNEPSVLEYTNPKSSIQHPTMKPVELVQRLIRNHTRPGDTVADPFGGSGSTLLAAHLAGARAILVEYEPGYCDVIRQRYDALMSIKEQ